jgi:alcohol dehydrogenase class IV
VNPFNWFQPTEIRFGAGRVREAGDVAARFGRRCLLVTSSSASSRADLYERVKIDLIRAGASVAHFDGVMPNPTTNVVTRGAEVARSHRADVVIGVGGGSAMDTAKAIAVEASHPGTAWDYLFYRTPQPDGRTLPVVAIPTTSGSASHVTQVAVVTNPATRDKSALYNPILYPRVGIVDPELMTTVAPAVTAATGFDIFAHSFESYLHPHRSAYTELLALEAIRIVLRQLPAAIADGENVEVRSALAWADTLAGLCIANAGVTLPHGVAMAIGGLYPHVAHGEALAAVYPAIMRFTWNDARSQFAALGRHLEASLAGASEEEAAEGACRALDRFLERIHLALTLDQLAVPVNELPLLARRSLVLPDYSNHPRLAGEADVLKLLQESHRSFASMTSESGSDSAF